MQLEEGDIVLCTVDKIVGTTVFVHIERNGEGNIIFSEIAPGRIRNIRDYVVPKKIIVCKVLRISGKNINLSLRRVTQKEKKEVLEKFKQEKSFKSILKSVLKENAEKTIKDIEEKESLYYFFQEAKENPEDLEKFMGKEDAKKILDILQTQKTKKAIIKKEILLNSKKPDGMSIIKNLLSKLKGIEVRYISAGNYSLKTSSDDLKKADTMLKNIISEIEKKAKKQGAEFSIREK